MTRNLLRRVAGLTLAALLFSAVSPALAALFVDRAEFAARILGTRPAAAAAPAATPPAADHDHAADGHDGHGGEHDEHAAHAVFCSFCLSGSSQLALPISLLTEAAPAVDATPVDDGAAPFVTRFSAPYQPRGPPAR